MCHIINTYIYVYQFLSKFYLLYIYLNISGLMAAILEVFVWTKHKSPDHTHYMF